jgi:tetratricopeptide (TPR) repeat protein
VREALYSGLPIGDRRELHRLVARALESMIERSPSVRCTDLARHFAAAAPHEDSLRAIPYFLDAARRDVETAAFESACSAIEAATALAESQYITDKDLWCRLRLRLGVVYGLLARREESRATLSRAAADAMEVGRSDVVCEAALAFAPDLLAVETGVFDADLVRLLRLAVRVSDDGQASVLSRLLARLAVALHWSDDAADEIPALVDQALTVARESADPEAQRFADTAGKLAKYSPGAGWSPEWDFSDAAGSDASTALMRGVLKVTGLVELGDVRSAEAEIDRFSELVEGVRKASARWYSDMFGATIALMRGEYESVLELTKQYLKQGMDVGDRNAFHSFALQRAMMAVDVGGLEEYEHSVARMVAEFPAVEGWGAGLCFLESEIGLSEEARKRIDRLLDAGILSRTPRNSWLGTIGCLTLAARNLARRDLGTDLYELWRPYSGGLAVIGFGSFCWGAADRFLGVLSGMLGKREEARAHFDAAFAMNERCGALPALAHSYRDRGIMESSWSLRGGDPFLGRAMELSESLGMKRLTAQVVRDRNGFDSL